jgi:hypothetical protein
MRSLIVVCVLGLGSLPALADEPAPPSSADASPHLVVPLTLVDLPDALALGLHFPTWEQALDFSRAEIELGHAAIHAGFTRLSTAWWSVALEMLSTAAFDLIAELNIGGGGWLHEEGHRAAMFASGVPSRQVFNNLFYRADEQCDSGSVCGMTDEQIGAVKTRSSAEWVRVQEAGMETELEQIRRVEKDVLFYGQPGYQQIPFYFLYVTSVIGYRAACAQPGGITEESAMEESETITNRDFTGPDCTGAANDLFRPDEPYEARGPHPKGGVRRIRTYDELTPEEQRYLRTMRNLSFLNLLDPNLIGLTGLNVELGGAPTRVNAALGHHLTSFGDAFFVSLFARRNQSRLYGELMLFRNQTGHFPGLRVELVRQPFHAVVPLNVSASCGVGCSRRRSRSTTTLRSPEAR